ncbi:MAG: cytochrome c family protein [Magnetospirillum sp.]|nr:cytochrome c family protein [Magnetospirillum sp.]
MVDVQKIAGGVLFALILFQGVRIVGDSIDKAVTPHAETQRQEAAEAAAAAGVKAPATPQPAAPQSAAAPPVEPLGARLAKASVAAGQEAAKKCGACHSFAEGAPNRVGPNLHGVVGRKVATAPGFTYSDALKKLGGVWTDDRIDTFITKPQAYAPGTKMGFPGDADPQDRANIIDYLNSISPNAPPPPK